MAFVSAIRQNFHEESENAINNQINLELNASYQYQSMAIYFDQDDVALSGFSSFFKHHSAEERDHAEKLMKYLNKRGGRVVLQDIKSPNNNEWGNGLNSLESALDLEKKVNESLLNIHTIASSNCDAHLANFLEEEFLNEQVEAIKELSDMITRLKRAGPDGLGEYLFDKDLKN
jgi:ferritin heavy chain